MKTKQFILSAVLFGVALTPLQSFATSFVFDNPGSDVVQPSITFNVDGITLDVTAGATKNNLHDTANFSTWKDANVFQDLKPKDGGLGVHGWGGGADNFQGSVKYKNKRWDEILFFDFNKIVKLIDFTFNGEHTELARTGKYGPRFSLYTSSNGTDYTSVFLSSSLASRELLSAGPGGVDSRYFALGAAAPKGSKSYVESLNVQPVPEPTTMFLFGTGLLGLIAASRRKRK